MPAATSPRAFAGLRLQRQRLVAIANSSVAWSRPLLEQYCLRRGVPLTAIIDFPLGTSPSQYDPGSNAALLADFITPLAEFQRARGASGVLLGPGVPARVTVRGTVLAGVYTAGGTGFPPLAHLAAGAQSYAARLAVSTPPMAARDDGSSRWTWSGVGGTALWSDLPWRLVGSTDTGLGELLTVNDAAPLASYPAYFPTADCVALLGRPESEQLPVGRVGYSAWSAPTVAESSSNALAALPLADLGATSPALAGPVIVSIEDVSGTDGDIWAALYARLVEWGYPAAYVYRTTPTGSQTTYAPLAGALASAADWASTVTDQPYSMLLGCALNADTPQSGGVGFGTLAPGAGSGVATVGPSAGYQWGLRQLTLGAAWAVVDQTHKNLGTHRGSWSTCWWLLAGVSAMEACYWGGGNASFLACGDPLAEPFRLYAGAQGGLSADRPRRWANRRLRATA